MSHFAPEDWVDFVRNAGETELCQAELRREMQSHCDRDCPECGLERAMWSSVASSFAAAIQSGPDESLVRAVTAVFGLYGPQPKQGFGEMARILVDSALSLAPGVRAGESSSRQLLFEQDGIHVDLRIEAQPETKTLMVVGQVLKNGGHGPFVSAAPVLLVGRNTPWRYLVTNEVGEFQFELEDLNDMHLAFGLAAGQTVLVPLGKSPSPTSPVPLAG